MRDSVVLKNEGIEMCMKLFKKAAALMCVAALMAGLCSSVPLDASSPPDEYHDDWLHVEGNKICDMYGNEVWLTGCNWFGFNVGSQVFDGVWSQNMHDMLRQIADRGLNFLRIPVSTQILLQWKNDEPDPSPPKVNESMNPELDGMNSKQLFNQAVEWCRELGIKIMIDIHSAETHAAGHVFALWYNEKYSTEDMYDALTWFADEYKDDDTILAIDIKNEPHGTADTPNDMAKWDDTTDANNWRYVAETAGNKILDINPNLLIMVEGIEVYPKETSTWSSPRIDWTTGYEYYYHTWWGGNLRGVRDYPINIGKDNSQLVYSPHDYGPLVYNQKWFEGDFTFDSLMEDCWYDNWAYLYEEGISPLLIGEWGGFIDDVNDADGKNRKWLEYLRSYIIDNRIHHTFWCFNENSGDTGGLVYDNFSKWDEQKYALLEPALWQDDEGKFISLDHKTPLGANGISLSDHYSGSSGTSPKKGDCNLDGKVNVVDIMHMKSHLISGLEINLENADMSDDGKVTTEDIKLLSNFILGK